MRVNDNPSELRALDTALARAIGWALVDETPHPEYRAPGQKPDLWFQASDGMRYRVPAGRTRIDPSVDFCPSTDPAAIRLIEDEIERRGLRREYVFALFRQIDVPVDESIYGLWHVGTLDLWAMVHATPEQRARAALATLSGSDIAAPHQP